MNLTKLLAIIGVCISCGAYAQDLTVHVNKKGKVGFTDKSGAEIIKCAYDNAQPFKNGISIVSKSEKYGIINTKGEVVLPLAYTSITKWNDKLFLIKAGKKMGLADYSGKIVLQPIYSNIGRTNCYGKALISLGGKATANEKKTYMYGAKYGIIDETGKILVTPTYSGLYEFSYDGSNSVVFTEGKRLNFSYHYTADTLVTDCSYLGFNKNPFGIYKAGIMDGNGKELVPMKLYDFVMLPLEGMVRYYNYTKKLVTCGYHDIESKKGFVATTVAGNIETLAVWTHGDFYGDLAPVRKGDSWSLIDKSGKEVRKGYSAVTHSKLFNIWGGKNGNGIYEVFDEKNNDVNTLAGYTDIKFPAVNDGDEVYVVQKDEQYGAVTRSGDTVVPFEYDLAGASVYSVVPVKKNGKWGMVSAKNDTIIPLEYTDVVLPNEKGKKDYWVMKSDSLFYHYNTERGRVSGKAYKAVTNFVDGIAFVAPRNINVKDTPLNRAQSCLPNTSKTVMASLDWKQMQGAFGVLVKADDTVLTDQPVSTLCKDAVLKRIKELGNRKLTASEMKDILLEVTKENRSYDLKSRIDEEEWNY